MRNEWTRSIVCGNARDKIAARKRNVIGTLLSVCLAQVKRVVYPIISNKMGLSHESVP
jgi:hypothetical protein